MLTKLKLLAIGSCFALTACEPGESTNIPGQGTTGASTPTGTQSGATQGHQPDAVHTPYCKRVEQLLPNADTPVGAIIPRELASKAEFKTRGRWVEQKESTDRMVKQSLSPSAHDNPGEIEVAYADGAVRFVKSEFVDCTPGVACSDIGVTCVDTIEVDLKLSMRSDNGVFAESWTGTLVVSDPRDPDQNDLEPEEGPGKPLPSIPSEFQIQTKIDPIAFAGTASLKSEILKPDFKITKTELSFTLHYKEQKFSKGTLSATTMVVQDPLPGDGSGVTGASVQTLYAFNPDI